jgi:hypothetical protein
MAMPKGFKSTNGYATTNNLGGKSYQQIADIMNDNGFKMNHSTARNVCVNGLKKLVISLLKSKSIHMSEADIIKIAKDPRFQEGVADIIREEDGIKL